MGTKPHHMTAAARGGVYSLAARLPFGYTRSRLMNMPQGERMRPSLRRHWIGPVLVLLAAGSPAFAQPTAELAAPDLEKAERLRQDLSHMVSLARDRVFPALVNIRVITVRYWNGKEEK